MGGLGQKGGLVAFQALLDVRSLLVLGIPQPSAARHGSAGSHVLCAEVSALWTSVGPYWPFHFKDFKDTISARPAA